MHKSWIVPALLLALACDGPGPPGALLEVHSGDAQGAEVGQPLPESLAVMARTRAGDPLADVKVSWLVSGGGSVSPATSFTGADGIARTQFTLAPEVGIQGAMAYGGLGYGVQFTSFGRLNGAVFVGNRTIGPLTDTTLGTNDQPLVVMVTNEKHEPVPGYMVTWAAGGGGAVSASAAPTDAGGESIVTYTYGPTAGTYTATATVQGLRGSPISFTLNGTAGNAVSIEKTVGDNLSFPAGSQLVYVVTARDARGNPVNGVRLQWSVGTGAGTISPTQNFTGDVGTATAVRRLGPAAGTQTVTVTAPELPGAPTLTFTTIASP